MAKRSVEVGDYVYVTRPGSDPKKFIIVLIEARPNNQPSIVICDAETEDKVVDEYTMYLLMIADRGPRQGKWSVFENVDFMNYEVEFKTNLKVTSRHIPKIDRDQIRALLADPDHGCEKVLKMMSAVSVDLPGYNYCHFDYDDSETSTRKLCIMNEYRHKYTKVSWVILTQELINGIIDFCGEHNLPEVVEFGSGNGLLIALLSHPQTQRAMTAKYGFATKFIATEPFIWDNFYTPETCFCEVEKLTAIETVEKYPETPLMSVWPANEESYAHDALSKTKASHFIYIGEDPEGCTANDAFFRELRDNWSFNREIEVKHWAAISDGGTGFIRRKEGEPVNIPQYWYFYDDPDSDFDE